MIVRSSDRRRTLTPNAEMLTLASPTQGGSESSLWLVDMPARTIGPWHAFNGEVVWSITSGDAVLEVSDTEPATGTVADVTSAVSLAAGDTAVLPAGRMRRLTAGPAGFTAVVCAAGGREVTRDDGTTAGVPPWVS